MAQCEVDLEGGRVRGVGRKTGPRKEALRHTVVAKVLLEARLAPPSDLALATEPTDQAELLERPEMGESGGCSDPETLGDGVQRDAATLASVGGDEAKGLELSPRQALERLHVSHYARRVFTVGPNF